ncbi:MULTISPECIES: hypothetical protein [unclassified Picosynechococcus]|nr:MULTISPECIES: hypothetical protein [unclassified Picosynechococcus]
MKKLSFFFPKIFPSTGKLLNIKNELKQHSTHQMIKPEYFGGVKLR